MTHVRLANRQKFCEIKVFFYCRKNSVELSARNQRQTSRDNKMILCMIGERDFIGNRYFFLWKDSVLNFRAIKNRKNEIIFRNLLTECNDNNAE